MRGVSPVNTACVTRTCCCAPPSPSAFTNSRPSPMFTNASAHMIQYADCGMRISDCGLEDPPALINPQSEIRIPQSTYVHPKHTHLHDTGSVHDRRRGVARRGFAARTRRRGLQRRGGGAPLQVVSPL